MIILHFFAADEGDTGRSLAPAFTTLFRPLFGNAQTGEKSAQDI